MKTLDFNSKKDLILSTYFNKVIRREIKNKDLNKCNLYNKIYGLQFFISPEEYALIQDEQMGIWSSTLSLVKSVSEDNYRLVYFSNSYNQSKRAYSFDIQDNHRKLGDLLGYPSCCIESYYTWLQTKKHIDPIEILINQYHSRFETYEFPNPFLRYLNYDFINHYPCSLNCSKTVKLANKIKDKLITLNNLNNPFEKSISIYIKNKGFVILSNYIKKGKIIYHNKEFLTGTGVLYEKCKKALKIKVTNSTLQLTEAETIQDLQIDFIGEFKWPVANNVYKK